MPKKPAINQKSQTKTITYKDKIQPWHIYRRCADGSSECVAKFKNRDDAVAYLDILRGPLPLFPTPFYLEYQLQRRVK